MTKTNHFTIPYYQYLEANGTLKVDSPSVSQDLDTLKRYYRTMVLIRLFDSKAIRLQRTGKIGTYAPILGQEAISTVVGHLMQAEDILIPYYRDHAALYTRGVGLDELLAVWGGDERGNDYRKNPHDFPIAVPIASQLLHACGVAYAATYQETSRVVVASCGDGATSEGDFYEAINLAGAWQLPIVFVINNNQWAISVSRAQQTHTETLAQKAIAAGIPGIQIDGNDVIALHDVIHQSILDARAGKGPVLLEALTYRLGDHTTADDASRYRKNAQVKSAWAQEPIKRLANYLQSQNAWSDSEETQLQATCTAQIDTAVNQYLNQPPQTVEDLFNHHFASTPAYLEHQINHAKGKNHG